MRPAIAVGCYVAALLAVGAGSAEARFSGLPLIKACVWQDSRAPEGPTKGTCAALPGAKVGWHCYCAEDWGHAPGVVGYVGIQQPISPRREP